MTRQEMIDLIGWHYQTMTVEEQNILSRVEHIVEVAVLRERNACAKVCDFEVARLHAIDEPRPALAVGICAAVIRARGQA